jgi:hypothetical protein
MRSSVESLPIFVLTKDRNATGTLEAKWRKSMVSIISPEDVLFSPSQQEAIRNAATWADADRVFAVKHSTGQEVFFNLYADEDNNNFLGIFNRETEVVGPKKPAVAFKDDNRTAVIAIGFATEGEAESAVDEFLEEQGTEWGREGISYTRLPEEDGSWFWHVSTSN